jgi:hypothetical protein
LLTLEWLGFCCADWRVPCSDGLQSKVLERCTKPELNVVLEELHDLFFVPAYRTDVTPEEFIQICERHLPVTVA